MTETLIGTVKGPGENPHEYTFITSDNKSTRIGEFVYYIADTGDDAGKLNIVGTITERTLVRSLPDSFLADPNTPPSLIASLIGLPDSEVELYEITVEAIGYFNEGLGDFINPRIPPMPGQPVFIASNEMLSKMLSPKQQGQVGGAHIGSLLTRKKRRSADCAFGERCCFDSFGSFGEYGRGKKLYGECANRRIDDAA